MLTKREKYDALVEHFIWTGQLGHNNTDTWSITLYNIPNDRTVFARIRNQVDSITHKYNFIIDDGEKNVNITIADIEL